MTDHLAIWNTLGKTDPAHTKQFSRAGGFKGTAIKPQWVLYRLTEQFGPCGAGWGISEQPTFQVVHADKEVLVYCTVACWHGSPDNVLWGVGGDKVVTARSSGTFCDDEAFKKAFTDAVMNAFKFIGVGADVHMGLFDDNKYVAEVRQEFTQAAPAPVALGSGQRDTGSGEPGGKDWWGCSGPGLAARQAQQQGLNAKFDELRHAFADVPTSQGWRDLCRDNHALISTFPKAWRTILRAEADLRAEELGISNERAAA